LGGYGNGGEGLALQQLGDGRRILYFILRTSRLRKIFPSLM
jgi:hypothetical protein